MAGTFYSLEAFIAKQQKASDVKTGGETSDIAVLKARATELGVAYADNIGAKKLAERIAEKEKELADASGDAD